MNTTLNPISVPGWARLKRSHPTRGLALQALVNLELAYYQDQGERPTRQAILLEIIRLGGDLSPTSLQTVQRHLDALAEMGHVIKAEGRCKSPWRSCYILLEGN